MNTSTASAEGNDWRSHRNARERMVFKIWKAYPLGLEWSSSSLFELMVLVLKIYIGGAFPIPLLRTMALELGIVPTLISVVRTSLSLLNCFAILDTCLHTN